MARTLKFRNHAAERERIDAANRAMEIMYGDLREAKGMPKPTVGTFTPKRRIPRGGGDPGNATDIDAVHRTHAAETAKRPLEAEVIRAVEQLLRVHPRVLWALRMNAGSASYESKTGKYAPVWFHRWVRSPSRFRMADFIFLRDDGKFGAIECKRLGFRKPTDQREREQAAFLSNLITNGCLAGFATSADDALAIIISA